MTLPFIAGDEPVHYTEQKLRRDPTYEGAAAIWSEEEANAVLVELFGYFGLRRRRNTPIPPTGLPATSLRDAEAIKAIRLGVTYLAAIADRQPRVQWRIHDAVSELIADRYRAARRDLEKEQTEAATANIYRMYEEGQFHRPVPKVYFVAAPTGPVKIGMAIDPERRLAGLQTSYPDRLAILATTEGGIEQERAYHARFAAHRLQGEWFERCPEIEAEIARLNRPNPQ